MFWPEGSRWTWKTCQCLGDSCRERWGCLWDNTPVDWLRCLCPSVHESTTCGTVPRVASKTWIEYLVTDIKMCCSFDSRFAHVPWCVDWSLSRLLAESATISCHLGWLQRKYKIHIFSYLESEEKASCFSCWVITCCWRTQLCAFGEELVLQDQPVHRFHPNTQLCQCSVQLFWAYPRVTHPGCVNKVMFSNPLILMGWACH